MIPKFINKLGKCALLDNPLNTFFMFRYFRNHFVNKYKHTYSQKMPLTALILTITIIAHKKKRKVQKLHFKRLQITPKAMETKCYHSQWAHHPYTAQLYKV